MKLDRDMQHRILQACADIYPEQIRPEELLATCGAEDTEQFMANVAYLAEHGLLDCKLRRIVNGPAALGICTITARGLDFLADDGGLTAILGTVVVKLHADTIREMLIAKAEASALAEPEKSALRKQIASLPAAALQTATSRLAQVGLDHVPDLLHWLRTLTGL